MGYNKQKLQIGYKGKFVIHDHFAQSHHWDLRLEFPVDSLKDSLTSYYKKRVWDNKTTEPKSKFPDKSGTVLRSWAIPKHKLPGAKPILATETEDHDIGYKDFKGTIPEGHYGAGTVDIYDKGTFELVDIEYDKKYVIKFNGKKVKGYYALVKTHPKKFLWIKVKDISEYKEGLSERIIKAVIRVEFPSPIPTYQISNFEQQVNRKIKKLEPGQKINIAITTIDSYDIRKVEKKLKRLGYTVYVSSGYMTVKK